MKCGLEIHQRINTNKLFCSCPSETKETPVVQIKRKQHPVVSELGKMDVAVEYEYLRDREFTYDVYRDSSCLVEADCEPPHGMNEQALDIVIGICLSLKASIVDEVQVMRKTVIDGSNTSGFQRTSVIGLNGSLETSKGIVGISSICLEEESAGIVNEKDGKVNYRLDRLGIPLVEIATAPDIVDQEHAREVAEKIGLALRATGKVQRGIGTIRQDLNVSIEGGARVEIKGAQELDLIAKLVENEALRQKKIIEINEEIKKRSAKVSDGIVDVTDVFSATSSKLIQKTLEKTGKVLAIKLEGYAGLLGKELLPNRRYGTELSDYAKSVGVKGIIHSDENLAVYGIGKEVEEIKKILKLGKNDSFVLVAENGEMARKALQRVVQRARMREVPEETRKALPDGTTAYLRPLPGSARLYPETDVRPVRITKDRVQGVKKSLPEDYEKRKEKILGMLNKELADKIIKSKNLRLFERVVNELRVEPVVVATTLEETLVSLRREGVNIEGISENNIYDLFTEYANGLFVKAAIPEILASLARNKKSVKEIVKEGNLERIAGKELEKLIKEENFDF
ncbi:Glu-tRNA(Gln) amidotransferase subunit GatE, partial [Candidatus Micrarchaeota archaeon]|nr:Glu-tRNA(Gln) amidotransferase subunit GatE [Candidatus Micrarchaeota archaeon]